MNGEPVALGSPSLPRPNNGGRAGGEGAGLVVFFFFFFSSPLSFLYIPLLKSKSHTE